VKKIEARPLNELEAGWVRDILRANPDWHDADFGRTSVTAEGHLTEGYSLELQAPQPQNPISKSSQEIVGQLWIETEDRLTINVQLSQ
jgi:hypothetical protein